MYIDMNAFYPEDATNYPPRVRTGVYSVGDKPHYIVELLVAGSGEPENVTVYEAVADPSGTVGKAYTIDRKTIGFPRRNLLGRKAAEKHPDQVKEKRVTNRPLYMSEVEVGKDTFTEHVGRGFRDRVKVEVMPKGTSGGTPTGVFITLDSITWKSESILPEHLLMDIKARQQVLLPYD